MLARWEMVFRIVLKLYGCEFGGGNVCANKRYGGFEALLGYFREGI